MKKLQIIVKEGISGYTYDEIIMEISQASGVDIKENARSFAIESDRFYIWQNVLLDEKNTNIVGLKRKLKTTLDASIEEMPTTWWGRNSEKAFIFMGSTSVIGLIVGLFSWILHESVPGS